MRTRCPSCGTTLSLDALIAHDAGRDALAGAFRLGGALGGALVRYLALFRSPSRELTFDRVAKLLGELLPDLQAQRITRKGQVYEAPPDAWIWAIEQTLTARDEGRLTLPLTGHGWLYEVISSWRPQQALVARESRTPDKPQSKTAAAIAALEARIRG
jgi:hypothetical protein